MKSVLTIQTISDIPKPSATSLAPRLNIGGWPGRLHDPSDNPIVPGNKQWLLQNKLVGYKHQ